MFSGTILFQTLEASTSVFGTLYVPNTPSQCKFTHRMVFGPSVSGIKVVLPYQCSSRVKVQGNCVSISVFVQGGKVVIADLQVSNGESVAKEIGENASFVPTDVSVTVLSFNLPDSLGLGSCTQGVWS